MSDSSLYRKYRSKNFAQLVGQSHIKTTLSHAIELNRVGHAYIFSGPRGTGKTSTARILAKSLNCQSGPTVSPCLTCDNCRKITDGHSVDVIEIDAASHTGVDNIRDINAQVNFMPVECRYKLYIIDEVHMLSIGAFNALLKTLEEPPANTIFILATTEPQKLPATIHSRCQTLQFRQLNPNDISAHLQEIAQKESVQIEEAAARLIASQSAGCMRDALSLFEQVISFTGDLIRASDVRDVLGAVDTQILAQLLTHIISGELLKVTALLADLFDKGAQASQLCIDLLQVLRDLILYRSQNQKLPESLQSCATITLAMISRVMENVARLLMELRLYPNPEIILQVRLAVLTETFQQSGATQTQATTGVAATAQVVSTSQVVSTPSHPTAATQIPANRLPESPQRQSFPSMPVAKAPVQVSVPAAAAPVAVTTPVAQAAVVKEPVSPVVAQAAVHVPVQVPTQAPVVQATMPIKPAAPVQSAVLSEASQIWDRVIQDSAKQNRQVFSIISSSKVVKENEKVVWVRLQQNYQFFVEKLKENRCQQYLNQVIQQLGGSSKSFQFLLAQEPIPDLAGKGELTSSIQENSVDVSPLILKDERPSLEEKPIPVSGSTVTLNQLVDLFEGTLVS